MYQQKHHGEFLKLVPMLSAGTENPIEREEMLCKRWELLHFRKGTCEFFTLYRGVPLNCISKGKMEKRLNYQKHIGKSAGKLESGQFDERME